MNFQSPYVDLPMRLTVRQNLTVYAGLYGVANAAERIAFLAEDLQIERAARPPDRQAVGRPEDPRRPRQGAAQCARAAAARRADRLARSRHRRLGAAEAQGLRRRAAAPRSCSPRTTWPRSSASPTASSCSMPAASSRTRRPRALIETYGRETLEEVFLDVVRGRARQRARSETAPASAQARKAS